MHNMKHNVETNKQTDKPNLYIDNSNERYLITPINLSCT